MKQRVVRRAVRHPNAGALRKADFIRQSIDLILERERIFRVGTGHSLRSVDTVPNFYFLDSLADGLDNASGVRAGRIGQRGFDGVSASAHIGVVRINARGVYAHQHLARGRFGCGNFFEL